MTKIWANENLRPTKIRPFVKFILKFTLLIWFIREWEKNMILTRRKKTQKKTTLGNDSDDTITESVSKLNKIVFYEDTLTVAVANLLF